jgi:hypothetical protein
MGKMWGRNGNGEQIVNYDTVISYETVQIYQITSPNFNYFSKQTNSLANCRHKLKRTNLLVVNQCS